MIVITVTTSGSHDLPPPPGILNHANLEFLEIFDLSGFLRHYEAVRLSRIAVVKKWAGMHLMLPGACWPIIPPHLTPTYPI